MVAGCFVGAHYEKARDWFYKNNNLVLIVFVLLTIAEETLSYIHFSGLRYFSWLENIRFLFCVSAVFFFFSLFSSLYREKPLNNRLARGIDGAAYPIFLAHVLVIDIINDIMHHFGITSVTLGYLIRIAVVYSVTLTVCILWNNNKFRLKLWLKKPAKITVMK